MATTRDIKKRIKGVKNIQQITRTMEMVAAAKLRRAQVAAQNSKPYAEKINAMVHNISEAGGSIQHPLLKTRPVKKEALIVVSSNKGLCGAFNSNILRKVADYIKRHSNREFFLYCLGKKANDFFKRRGFNIKRFHAPSDKKIELSIISEVVREVSDGYEGGEYDQVSLFYSQFISTMLQNPMNLAILPFSRASEEDEEKPRGEKVKKTARLTGDYIFEPDPEDLMAELIPKYLETQLYNALVQSQAGEQASRLIAMKNATDNAKDMINALTLSYNKARQAGITKEILEVIGGSEAVKSG